MNYVIKQKPAFTVTGLKNKVKTSKSKTAIPKIWVAAKNDGTIERLGKLRIRVDFGPQGILGICGNGQSGNPEVMEYYLAVTTQGAIPDNPDVKSQKKLVTLNFPDTTWAIFSANGELPDAVQLTINKIHNDWLPDSGYELNPLPEIECYMSDNTQEVWVSVTKIGAKPE